MKLFVNDFEKALDFLSFIHLDGMDSHAASVALRELHGSIHENVAEWVEWLERNCEV